MILGNMVKWAPDRMLDAKKIGILLHRRGHYLFGRAAGVRIDNLHPRVSGSARAHHFNPAIMPIQTDLREHDANGSARNGHDGFLCMGVLQNTGASTCVP